MSNDELKRGNSPPESTQTGNRLGKTYKSEEFGNSSHHPETNMSDHNNRTQAFFQNNQSFNEVRDDYTEQAVRFSDNIGLQDQTDEIIESPKLTKEYARINQTEQRLISAIDKADSIEEEFDTIKVKSKTREYIEDENGDLHKVKKNGSVSKRKSYLSDKDKENRATYKDNEKKNPKDLLRSHSYSEQLYQKDDGNEYKRVIVNDTRIDRDKKRKKLCRRDEELRKEGEKLERMQKHGRLLFYGSNVLRKVGKSLDERGNNTDEAAKKAIRTYGYASKRLINTALIRTNRLERTFSKGTRYRLKSEKAKLEVGSLQKELTWQRDRYERDKIKERYRKSQKTKKDREKKRKELKELHKKQDTFFQRVHQKKAFKKKKKKLRSETRKRVISMVAPLGGIFITIALVFLILLLPFIILMGALGSGIGEFTSQNSYETLAMTNEFFSDLMVKYEMFVSPGYEDNYESILIEANPDIYEFIYDIPDEFKYDTVLLKAYLSARYKTYDITDPEIQEDLKEIFELYALYDHEIKKEYRDIPIVDAYGNVTGYEKKLVDICYIHAELMDLEEILKARVDDTGKEQIDKYIASGLGLNVFGPVMAESWGYEGATYRVSSEFGYRTAPKEGASTNHGGIDIACPTGTLLYSAVTGTVEMSGDSGKGGLRVRIVDDDTGIKVVYMHMSDIAVSAGTHVSKGEYIGKSGATGNVTGPHLHLEVHDPEGNKHDPRDYIPSILE